MSNEIREYDTLLVVYMIESTPIISCVLQNQVKLALVLKKCILSSKLRLISVSSSLAIPNNMFIH